MRYIYMNNFRGFSDALVPLAQTNFLVGENSTGKSSFLALLSLVNQPGFWFNPTFSMRTEADLSSFGDIVSAWSPDKTIFQVGVASTEKNKSGKYELSFSIHEFSARDDVPSLTRHIKLNATTLTIISFEKSKTKYCVEKVANNYASENEAIGDFSKKLSWPQNHRISMKSFPKEMPPNSPLPMVLSILQSIESGEITIKNEFKIEIPFSMNTTWIAPIRTKPKRIYDGAKIGYSPEGEHVPMLLRQSLRSKSSSKRFADRLSEFGRLSGLFETVTTHSFGKGLKNPFEVLIRFKGADLNISNVGYGVSQALPLIVEFLTTEKRKAFAVQQPEVHLHPKAQAALGGLIFELAKERKHAFFIETHSDFLIDRYRLSMSATSEPPTSQMLFFLRTPKGNKVHPLSISNSGLYPLDQPKEFRDFFVKEEIKLLNI